MIIDTDRWKNIPEVIQNCKKLENMFVAVSNPCFEFWLLLHIKDVKDYNEEELQLLLENRKTGSRNYVDSKIVELLKFYNKKNLKTEYFIPTIDAAIFRAKELDQSKEDFPTTLGSHIYKLMEKLIK